jgi:hypothetical protein
MQSQQFVQSVDSLGVAQQWVPVAAFSAAGLNSDPTIFPTGTFVSGVPLTLSILELNAGRPVIGTDSVFQRGRAASRFFSQRVSVAGPTVLWTPSAGNRFVLMGALLSVSGVITGGATLQLDLVDGATVCFSANATCADPLLGDTQIAVDYGEGYQSIAADNTLSLTLAPALNSGSVAATVWGIED